MACRGGICRDHRYQISGSADYLIHAVVEDLNHYQVLLDNLTAVEGVSKIQSNFVVKTFVQRPQSYASAPKPTS